MSKRGNGADNPEDGQTALDLNQSSAESAADHEPVADVVVAANPVMELGNTQDGCWKVLGDGERVEISDEEWRKELTRLLASPAPQAS